MQYVWQHRLLLQTDLHTVDGRKVSIIDPGRLNTGSGPDFFNAKVNIGSDMWAGDVEIHVRASDWHRHGHDGNPAYDSVVLHVVDSDDDAVRRSNGEVIPQMVMRCAPDFHVKYASLVDRSDIDLPCTSLLRATDSLHVNDWLTAMAYERLYDKADRLTTTVEALTGDWEAATYILLARSLGFGTNSDPMERLAKGLPLQFLRKHADSVTAIEALLFGQGGFLNTAPADDPYVALLQREYKFFAHKFGLQPMVSPGWRTGRMRPANQPHRRVAVLASLICTGKWLVDSIIRAESPEEIITFFRPEMSEYWHTHYSFGSEPSRGYTTLSRASAIVLVINVAIPLMMAYGLSHGLNELCDKAVEWLCALPPESNHIISLFADAGIKAGNAFASQALIQVRRQYCERHACMYCRMGHRLLASHARR